MEEFLMQNKLKDVKHVIKKHAPLLSLILFIIILFTFKSKLRKYQYIAEWISTISLIGVFMQLQWRHQDMRRKHLKEKRDHQILWTVEPHTGIFSGIINNKINWPLIYVKNFSGKYVHYIKIKLMVLNVNKLTSKGEISTNPNGKLSKHRKGNMTIVTVPGPWSYSCNFILNNTYGDSESTTPVVPNKFLFQLFHKYFNPGKYKFTLLFLCLRNSHREKLHVIYKYCNNVHRCQVLNLDKVKNE